MREKGKHGRNGSQYGSATACSIPLILHQEVTESQSQDHPTHEEKTDLSDEMGSRCSHHHWSELTPLHYQAVCVGATVFHGTVQLMRKVRFCRVVPA